MNNKTLRVFATCLFVALLSMPAAMAQSAFSNAVYNLGPVAYWPLQETVQPPAADVEANLGTLGAVANAYYSSTNVIKGVTGIPSGDSDTAIATSATLNGSFLAVPLTDSRVSLQPGPFSVEVWVNSTNVTSVVSTILAQTGPAGSAGLNGGANSAGWSLNFGYSPALGVMPSTVVFHVYNGAGAYGGAEASFTSTGLSAGNWYHVVGVFDGTNAMIYVNDVLGNPVQPMTGTQARDTWDPLTIGCGRGLNNNRFGGSIDEVAIYTNALSAARVQAHYNAGNGAGNYSGTVLADHPFMYWRMNAAAHTTPSASSYPAAMNYGTGSGINGLYLSGTTPGVAGPTNAGFGSPSYACSFNGLGTDDTNQIPIFTNGVSYAINGSAETGVIITNLLSSMNLFTNSMTFMSWFRLDPTMNQRGVLVGHGDSSWRTSMSGGAVTANTGKGSDISSSPLTYNDGNWHFAVIVYTNTGVPTNTGWYATNYVYVDGLLTTTAFVTNGNAAGSLTNISIGVPPDHTRTGAGNTYDDQVLAGSLAHVAFFNQALSASQIVALYTNATGGALPAPVITGQPVTGRTAGAGGSNGAGTGSYIFFGVTAVGATTYQWYYNSASNYSGATPLATDNVKYVATTSNNMTVSNLVDGDSGYYYVVVGNGFGSVTSILATLTIHTEPVITGQSPASGTLTLFQNQTAALSVNAIGTNLVYQWLTNGVADTAAGTASTYSVASVQTAMSGTTYQCAVSNGQGSTNTALVTLSVQPYPAALTNSAYSSNILALSPSGYWPLHEVGGAVRGDVETNLGSLGNLANGYYADWAATVAGTGIIHQVVGAITNDPDPAVGFNDTPNNGSTGYPGYVLIPRTAAAATLNPPFAIECWAKPFGSGFGDIISEEGSLGQTNQDNDGIRLSWGSNANGANSQTFQVYIGNIAARTAFASSSRPINQWYHLVVTYDATNFILFINGIQAAIQATNSTFNWTPDSGNPIAIATGLWNGSGGQRGWDGSVDEVAIYTNLLDPNEIQRHYNIGVGNDTSATYKAAVLETNPVIYLRMDAPIYSAPAASTWPAATNYGTVGGNGVYSPGSFPGAVAGPRSAALPSTSVMPGNGMSSFVDAGNNAAFNPTGATAFSYGAWFRGNPGDSRSFQTVFGHSDSSIRAAINSTGKLQAHGGGGDVTSPVGYNDGNWHQFFVTFTGTNVTYAATNTGINGVNTLYVDGVQVAQTSGTANPGTNLDLMIGNDPQYTNNVFGMGRCFAGQVCEAAFWNGVTLSSSQVAALYSASAVAPVITTQPVSATANANANFTNTVVAFGSGLTYQWYRDNLALPAAGQNNLPLGGTGASLAISPVKASDASTNYYVVVSNSGGSVTSAVVSLAVFTQPVFTNEPVLLTLSNNILLFAGAAPAYKALAVGAQPTLYQWYTNGLAATTQSAANTNYTLPAMSLSGGVTNFFCVASNFVGQTTNTPITITVLPAPTAPYPAQVLLANPLSYWRLDEPDNGQGSGNAGDLAYDYWSGINGIYTNVDLGNSGYSAATDPGEKSASFELNGNYPTVDNDAYGFGTDFGSPTNTSVAFSVEAWVDGYTQTKDAGIVSKGYGGAEQFDLDTGGSPSGTDIHSFRFFVRDVAGNTHAVSSSVKPDPNGTIWHHLVGVCDEVNGALTLYVDGAPVGSAAIAAGSGLLSSARAMVIGSRTSNGTTNANDLQFVGYIDDVATYNYALSAGQVAAHYSAAGVPPNLYEAPSSNYAGNAFSPLTLNAAAVGTGPIGYYWTDVSSNRVIAAGSTSVSPLNATLSIPSAPPLWNSDTLMLTVSNAYGTTNITVNLALNTNAPVVTLDLPPLVTVVSGKTYNYSIGIAGPPPYFYQWYNGASAVANQTGSIFTVTSAVPGSTTYFVIVSNQLGSATSSVSTFVTISQLTNRYAAALLGMGAGPVGYWPLQETNAPIFATAETNYGSLGSLGTLYYVITNAASTNIILNQSGVLANDSAVRFNGPSAINYGFVPQASGALTTKPPFSWELWLNSSSGAFSDIMSEGGAGLDSLPGAGTYTGFRLSWGGNNGGGPNAQVYAYDGSGGTSAYNSFGSPAGSTPFGSWHHIVTTYDGTTCLIYVDGQLEASANFHMATNTWTPLTIGDGRWLGDAGTFGPTRSYYGELDEVAVYTNLLSPAQVTNHYAVGEGLITADYFQTVTNDQPLLYYRMDAAGYTNPPATAAPQAVNYGTAPVNGLYLPGTLPGGVAGPTNAWLATNTAGLASPINGVVSCIDAGSDSSFNPTGNNPFTALCWFRGNPADGRVQTIMSHGVTNWAMNLDGTTGHVVWNLFNGGQVTSTGILNDGAWHHLAGVYDGSKSYLYVDGALNGSITAAGSIAGEPNAHIYLGGNIDFSSIGVSNRFLAGSLAQAAFFTNALTAGQIQVLYAGTPPVTPTISIAQSGANLVISYTGVLLSSTNVALTNTLWTSVITNNTQTSSNYTVSPTGAQMYYRAQQPH